MSRGKPREIAILNATIELLQMHGYQALTIDSVAAHAHASKATIYRRWRNRVELVKAAIDAFDQQRNESIPDTGKLRSDLIAVLETLRDTSTAPYLAMINDLIAASKHDRELAAALQVHVSDEALSPFRRVLARAMARDGLEAAGCEDLIHDVAEAMIIRQVQLERPFDDAFIFRVVDDILLPLLEIYLRPGNSLYKKDPPL
ncbi:TetR/AcrR family transcriptional regulator [Aquirhabdus parva]|uniref:TetR/AcrR family transcriptional regulator n=1 Tax=Aquirhabdus parva TaxID=2283318 RepID=A0A345PA21_9GAMM|nr:TetR/AcrR family transcriptional regulator [Aquirhabdus parva]AXI04130.1 TetR/AcrR family transcriptional regulator [Aquirhabdus parva]